MAESGYWYPSSSDRRILRHIDRVCDELRSQLNDAKHVRVDQCAQLVNRLLTEFEQAVGGEISSADDCLYALLLEALEHSALSSQASCHDATVFLPYFPAHSHVIKEFHRARAQALPSEVGRYQIIEEIGRGGMGVVYLAYAKHLKRNVALKVFPEANGVTRAFAEVQHALELRHDAIVPIFDLDDKKSPPHIAMRHINGPTLKQRLQRGRTDEAETTQIMTLVSSAVCYAHTKGIIHRDLKPANILLDEHGHPLVSDFGLAIHRFNQAETIGRRAGTLSYMAPEQVRAETISEKADCWALGVILYELLTGETPFQGDDQEATQNAILHAPLEIADHSGERSRQLWSICQAALEKSLIRRITPAEFHDRIARLGNSKVALDDAPQTVVDSESTVDRMHASKGLNTPQLIATAPMDRVPALVKVSTSTHKELLLRERELAQQRVTDIHETLSRVFGNSQRSTTVPLNPIAATRTDDAGSHCSAFPIGVIWAEHRDNRHIIGVATAVETRGFLTSEYARRKVQVLRTEGWSVFVTCVGCESAPFQIEQARVVKSGECVQAVGMLRSKQPFTSGLFRLVIANASRDVSKTIVSKVPVDHWETEPSTWPNQLCIEKRHFRNISQSRLLEGAPVLAGDKSLYGIVHQVLRGTPEIFRIQSADVKQWGMV